MFQILTQTNAAVTALANQNTVGYAQVSDTTGPLPRNGWNTKIPVNEEQEQQNDVNNGLVFNTNSGAGPNPKDDPGA
ncbi:hypothetical protein CR513_25589, partial [Mucuna pruriens]